MTFAKRFLIHNKPVAPVVQQTCKRCCGARRVREGSNFIACRVCAGSGRAESVEEQALRETAN
jgi:DnaJ-class molecular chaperone